MNEKSKRFMATTTWYHNDLHKYVEIEKNFADKSKATCLIIKDKFDPTLKDKFNEKK